MTTAGGHDAGSCPELLAIAGAEQNADAVRLDFQAVAPAHRGRTGYVHLPVGALPSSTVLAGAGVSRTFFNSALEAKKYRERLLEFRAEEDTTIPQTQDERKAHVLVLFKAFKCVAPECQESDKIKLAFRNSVHDNVMVECLCWEILDACIRRSQVMVNLVETYEPGKYKFKKGLDKNFADRFDTIVQGMARSKSMCKHLFEVPFLFKVIDDPQSNTERIDSNRKLNGEKAKVMKRGKEVIKQQEEEEGRDTKRRKVQADDEDESEYDGEDQTQSRPVKSRARRRQTTSTAPQSTTQLFNTPRPPLASLQAMSAPAPSYQMMPSAIFSNQGSNMYNSTPTRSMNNHPMAAQSLLGSNNYIPTYNNTSYGPTAQTGYQSHGQQYNVQPSPFGSPHTFANLRNVPSQQAQYHSNASTRAPSRASNQQDPYAASYINTPNPRVPSNMGAPSWLAQPQAETQTSTSGYTSEETTTSAYHNNAGETQENHPDYKANHSEIGEDESMNSYVHGGDYYHTNNGSPASEEFRHIVQGGAAQPCTRPSVDEDAEYEDDD